MVECSCSVHGFGAGPDGMVVSRLRIWNCIYTMGDLRYDLREVLA